MAKVDARGLGPERRWYRCYIFDLDGTVYLGDELLPTVAESINRIRRRGAAVRFLSNNPTRAPEEYARKLTRLGLPTQRHEVANTLVTATRWFRANRPEAVVYPIGEEPLSDALAGAGIRLSDDPSKIDVVLASYDRSFDYRKLQIAFDAIWFHKRAVLMSTNPDRYCPFPAGRAQPDAAAVVAAIEACAGVTCQRTFGKPDPIMLETALERTGAEPSETLVVGDRLATDIRMARSAGMDAALVLTGDSRAEDLALAPPADCPTLVAGHLAELLPVAE
ncbi:MAG: HAD-IIA family hydrolase [Bifidobacteriaceae bacterium]|nr:HAD-IIA family hydrolase [Bifidobacteriaceae bacterium]